MLRRSAGWFAFAACALDVAAFLLPPVDPTSTGHSPQSDVAGALSLLVPHAKHQLITVPCQQCRPALSSEGVRDQSTAQDAYSVAVNFTVSHDGTRLELNGEPIYPLGLQIESIFRSHKTFVAEVLSSASVQDIEDGKVSAIPLEVTSHGLTIVEETVMSEEGSKLIPIELSIFELDNQPVSLDHVVVQLFKAESGELSIMHVGLLAPPPPRPIDFLVKGEADDQTVDDKEGVPPTFRHHHHPHPHPYPHHGSPHPGSKPKECKMFPAALCKFRNLLEAKISGMRKGGCRGWRGKHGRPHMGKLPGHIKPHFHRPDPNRPHRGPHHDRPHHMRPHSQHHRHHGHHHHHHFMHAITAGLAAALIPTMAGVAVGMAVSFLGLIVGRLVRFLWIKLYRGSRTGYASVTLDEQAAERGETKKYVESAAAELDAPPMYESAPTYEEAVRDEK